MTSEVIRFDRVFRTQNFDVQISTAELKGYFEHDRLGDECAGELWFEKQEGGDSLVLTDYDGVFELPKEVKQVLIDNGVIFEDDDNEGVEQIKFVKQ